MEVDFDLGRLGRGPIEFLLEIGDHGWPVDEQGWLLEQLRRELAHRDAGEPSEAMVVPFLPKETLAAQGMTLLHVAALMAEDSTQEPDDGFAVELLTAGELFKEVARVVLKQAEFSERQPN